MTACIFGASGLVGSQLLFICLHDENISKVKVFVRRKLAMKHEKLEQIVCDFSKPEQWSHELNDAVIFCSIGTTIRTAGSKEKFRAVDRDIPAGIAAEAERQDARFYVYISSVGANPASSNFYLKTKGESEEAIRQNYRGPLAILRPSMLLGKRIEFRLGEIIGKYMAIFVDRITFGALGKYRPIQATDVARAMIVSAMNKQAGVVEGKALFKRAAAY